MHSANLPKQYVIGLGKCCNTAISNTTNKRGKGLFILALFSFRMKQWEDRLPDQLMFNTVSAIKAALKATRFCPGWGNGEVGPDSRLVGCCGAAHSRCVAAASWGWTSSPNLSQGPKQAAGIEEMQGFMCWSIKGYLWPICEPADSTWQTHGRSGSQKGMVVFILSALPICNVTFDKYKEENKTL